MLRMALARCLVVLLLGVFCLAAIASAAPGADDKGGDAGARDVDIEGRGRRKKAIVPLLMGIVLKVSTLVPMSLMIMTFFAVTSLFVAKLALGLVAAVGAHALWKKTEHGDSELNELAAGIPSGPGGGSRRRIIHRRDPLPFLSGR